MKISVGVSNRHVHLTKEVYDKLFDEPLEKIRDLDQPGQFASNKTVSIENNGNIIENVRIVGPLREYNQVEISRTDAYRLKVDPPVKASGDLEGSLSITIYTDKAKVNLDKGLILSNRHIHINKDDLEKYKLDIDKEYGVKINGEKSGIIQSIYIKVTDKASFKLHLDTDDANAFNIKNGDEVELIEVSK